jgi:thiol-disulfide isomerase/thioredoxin
MQCFIRFFYYFASIVFVLLLPITASAEVKIEKSIATAIPPIIYNDEKGESQIFDASKNKLTALHFWATWCTPCIKEFPQLNEIQKEYSEKGFKILAISADGKDVAKVRKFYKDNKINNLDVLFDSNMSTFQKLGIRGLPTTVFINSAGKKIGRSDGAINWTSKETRDFIESQTGVSNK